MKRRIPLLVTSVYIGLILVGLIFALAVPDEFGFSFLPIIFASYPWLPFFSRLGVQIQAVSIVLGWAINTFVVYSSLRLATHWISRSTK